MSVTALVASAAIALAAVVTVGVEPARAACDPNAILGVVKTKLQAATDMPVRTGHESEQQYELLLAARAGLDAAPHRIETECAGDGFHSLVVKERNTVYRAWNDALSAGRALSLGDRRGDCRDGLRTVAGASVTNGWGLLNRLFREFPHPDGYATAHRLLLARARDLGVRLPPLGEGTALATLQHKNHWDAFSAGAFLPPFCTRY